MSELRKRDGVVAAHNSTSNSAEDGAQSHTNRSNTNHVSANGTNEAASSPSFVEDALKSFGSAYNLRSHLSVLFSRQDNISSRTDSLSCLDGYRALLCIWMICFHSMAYLLEFAPDKQFEELGNHPLMLFTMFGYLPVDGFFVLTGFLLALPIFQEEKKNCAAFDTKDKNKESNGAHGNKNGNEANLQNLPVRSWFSVENFHYRRIVRFLPTYILAFIMFCKVIFPGGIQNPISMVKNNKLKQFLADALGPVENKPNSCTTPMLTSSMLFLNNVLPFGGCMGWMWSLAVQFVFYIFFPIVIYYCLRLRKSGSDSVHILDHTRYLRFLFVLFAGTVLLRFSVFLHLRRFSDSLGPVKVFTSFFFYSNTFLRISTIFIGTFVAYISVYYKDHILRWRKEYSVLKRELLCGAVWLIVLCLVLSQMLYNYIFQVPVLIQAPGSASIVLSQAIVPYATRWDGMDPMTVTNHLVHWVYWALFIVGSPLCGLFFALILFMIVHRIGYLAEWFSDILSHRIWSPFSTLSFQAYFYHPMLMVRTYVFMISTWGYVPLSVSWFVAICIWNLCSTFGLSFFVWILVEQPMDILLRPPKATIEAEKSHKARIYNVCRRVIRAFAMIVTVVLPIANILTFLFVLIGWEPAGLHPKIFQQLNQEQNVN